jgi:heat shock protein HslJ
MTAAASGQRRRHAGALLLAVCGVVGCSGGDTLTSPTSAAELQGRWRLFWLSDATGVHREDLSADRFALTFSAGRLDVEADCNTCTATTTLTDSTLAVDALACTRAACASAPLDTRFTALLDGRLTVRINSRVLQLNPPQGQGELRFER